MTKVGQTVHIDIKKVKDRSMTNINMERIEECSAHEFDKMINALRERVNELLARNTELVEERRKIQKENDDLRKEIRQLNAFAQRKEQEAQRMHKKLSGVYHSLGIDNVREDNSPSA